ncbi:LOW QUALITY PROTEIN: hypothetical protein PSENEW3_00003464 [Picochlorum sp. SENEW3]|nr:LOW QUALITY PROTEIN: hypothetical protein PSENEW3_00003464 [Picochlorum sp. SENEW3]
MRGLRPQSCEEGRFAKSSRSPNMPPVMALSRSKNGTLSPTVAGRANKGGKQSGANDVDNNSKGRAPSIADGAHGGTPGEGGNLESIELSPSMWDGGRAIQWLEAYKRDLAMQ